MIAVKKCIVKRKQSENNKQYMKFDFKSVI